MPESRTKSESTQEPDSKREPREPRALSNEYHKARKQLMLWAGILFIWELVGLDLEKAKEAGGNFGAIISAIKSPQAVPWVLLILVGYFVFKLRIEWRQSNDARRKVREAKQDYYSACIVALAAFILYFGQAISRVQFADFLQGSNRFQSLLRGIASGGVIFTGTIMFLDFRSWKSKNFLTVLTPIIMVLVGTLALPIIGLVGRGARMNWRFALIGLVSGVVLFAAIRFVTRRGQFFGTPRRDYQRIAPRDS